MNRASVLSCHPRESGGPGKPRHEWIPACAGMTRASKSRQITIFLGMFAALGAALATLSGNSELEGYNIDVESKAYIDCDELLALSGIGNSMTAGAVTLRNSQGCVYLPGGEAGGAIDGSILNYSDNPLTLSGNSDRPCNRSGLTELPAGFVPQIVLHYDPSSQAETTL